MATVTVDRTSQRFTSSAQPEADVCCIHTTEVWGWPGYAGGGQAPHATIKPIAGKGIEVREHIPTSQYAKALMNLPGGVETNRRGVLQYELMGTCDPRRKADMYFWSDADDVVLAALADYLRPLLAAYKIPLTSPPFKAYPASYGSNGVRLSNTQWNSFNGLCGHEHVPENVHGDPGAFPIARFLTHLRQEDDMSDAQFQQLRKDIGYARDQSLAAIKALAKATGPAVDAAVSKALEDVVIIQGDVTVTTDPPQGDKTP